MVERRDDFPAKAITALWQGNKIDPDRPNSLVD